VKDQAPAGLRIDAKDGSDFYRRLAAFAYLSSLTHGLGAVVIAEGGFIMGSDGSVVADARYVAYTPEDGLFTAEAEGLLNAYDPAQELILLILDAQNRASCLQLTAQLIGATPKALCLDWVRGELGMPWLPGQLLALDEAAGGLPAGHYVFVWRDQATLLLRRVGHCDHGAGLEAVGDMLHAHVDFSECFRAHDSINLFEPESPE
jgi:hypothetical protein